MIIIHTPEGGTEERLDAGRLRASEIQIAERTADRPWAQIKQGVGDGEINALRVLGWVVKKRTQPALRFAEFDPFEGEIRSRLDGREVRIYAEAFVEKFRADPEQLADAFEELREAAADAEVCEQIIADVSAPKDPAPEPEPEPAGEESPASPSDG